MRRCPGSATEDFTDDVPRPWWDGGGTVRCNRCGKRVGLYAVGSATARQAGANDWRMKTHYVSQGGAGIMKFTVDPTYLDEKAAAWWKAKTPAMRGVLMQAVYELETSAPPAHGATHASERGEP